MELAGTGSCRANLTAEPAEAVDALVQQTRQSNGTGLALLWDKEGEGGGEGGGGGQHSKAGNRQANKKQRSDTPPAPLCFDQHLDLDSKSSHEACVPPFVFVVLR